jgi:hypothetical protein
VITDGSAPARRILLASDDVTIASYGSWFTTSDVSAAADGGGAEGGHTQSIEHHPSARQFQVRIRSIGAFLILILATGFPSKFVHECSENCVSGGSIPLRRKMTSYQLVFAPQPKKNVRHLHNNQHLRPSLS